MRAIIVWIAVLTLFCTITSQASAAVPAVKPSFVLTLPKLAREPVYKCKPKYCVIALGAKAETRMWLVLDGAVLYADLNGNGDLTQPGNRLDQSATEPGDPDPTYPFAEFHKYPLPGFPSIDGIASYRRIFVTHSIIKKEFSPRNDDDKQLKNRHAVDPSLARVAISLYINDKVRQVAVTVFADTPAEAPILHFGGPLTFAPYATFTLVPGRKAVELRVCLGTQGLGRNAFAILDYDEVPNDIEPTAEIVFRSKNPGKIVKIKTSLTRC